MSGVVVARIAAKSRGTAGDREEGLADVRLVHHAADDALAVVKRDEDSPVQLPGDEAARPVDRIDDPRVARVAALEAVLLAADAVVGKRLRDRRADQRLGVAIGRGDRVVVVLALVVDPDRDAEVRQRGRARGDDGAAGELEVIAGRHLPR
jgi:hypothetical protein